MIALAALLLQAAAPPAEALALGERLARTGTLAAILPGMAAKDVDELVAAHPELSAAERAELRRTAAATIESGSARLFRALGEEYARRLSPADLQALVAFNATPAAARHREASLPSVAGAMARLGSMDLKKDVAAAYCAKTGKLCAKP